MREDFDRKVEAAVQTAGLDAQAAAEALLNRMAFGPRPGEAEHLASDGVVKWVEAQLDADLPETTLETRLADIPAAHLGGVETMYRYPDLGKVYAHARHAYDLIPPRGAPQDSDWVKRKIDKFRLEQGYLDQDEVLYPELMGQKILRAVFASNQLREVLTDFWFNHFQRGGMDGLMAVAPFSDAKLAEHRPGSKLPAPKSGPRMPFSSWMAVSACTPLSSPYGRCIATASLPPRTRCLPQPAATALRNGSIGSADAATTPDGGATYPEGCPVGQSMRQIATLIKSDVGLRVALAEYPPADWDTLESRGHVRLHPDGAGGQTGDRQAHPQSHPRRRPCRQRCQNPRLRRRGGSSLSGVCDCRPGWLGAWGAG